ALGIEVYPNPFIDEIIIQSEQEFNFQSELYNTLGQAVKRFNGNKLSTSEIADGVYFLKIYQEGRYLGTTTLVKM
ncbi:MAG: T9SS type A sorting domain-containing protein, partial [Bacteroidota bacterium]